MPAKVELDEEVHEFWDLISKIIHCSVLCGKCTDTILLRAQLHMLSHSSRIWPFSTQPAKDFSMAPLTGLRLEAESRSDDCFAAHLSCSFCRTNQRSTNWSSSFPSHPYKKGLPWNSPATFTQRPCYPPSALCLRHTCSPHQLQQPTQPFPIPSNTHSQPSNTTVHEISLASYVSVLCISVMSVFWGLCSDKVVC